MSFPYSGPPAGAQPHPQMTPLPSLQNAYQLDSPRSSQILPPIHTQPTPQSSYPTASRSLHAPHDPRDAGSQSFGQGKSLNQLNTQHMMNPAQSYPPQLGSLYATSLPAPGGVPSTPVSSAMTAQQGYGSTAGMPPASPSGSRQALLPPFAPQAAQQLPPQLPPQQRDMRNMDPRAAAGPQAPAGHMRVAGDRPGPLPASNAQRPPPKNEDGKFPCAYCSKTYLHLKHLKRHHLRHTGERPYQCSLCHETFCRSDILKRHFTKCAQRRGNPTNATHMTHAQAHIKGVHRPLPDPISSQPGGAVALNPPGSVRGSWQSNGPSYGPNGEGAPGIAHGMPLDSSTTSRSSSIIRPSSASSEDKRRLSGVNGFNHPVSSVEAPAGHPATSNNYYSQERIPEHYPPPPGQSYYPQTSAPVSYPPAQATDNSQFYYGRNPYATYSGNHETWNSAFQPGAQGHVMFSPSS